MFFTGAPTKNVAHNMKHVLVVFARVPHPCPSLHSWEPLLQGLVQGMGPYSLRTAPSCRQSGPELPELPELTGVPASSCSTPDNERWSWDSHSDMSEFKLETYIACVQSVSMRSIRMNKG